MPEKTLSDVKKLDRLRKKRLSCPENIEKKDSDCEIIEIKPENRNSDDRAYDEAIEKRKMLENKYIGFYGRKLRKIESRPKIENMRFPFEPPKIVACEELVDYVRRNQEWRKETLTKDAENVYNHSDSRLFRRKYSQFEGCWNFEILSGSSRSACYRILGERILISQGRSPKGKKLKLLENWEPPTWLNEYIGTHRYTAPKKRILIARNITFNETDVIPVYSDVKNEKIQELNIMNSLTFEYGDVNRIDVDVEVELKEILEEAEKPENMIRCDCHNPEGPLISCYENKDCPCYRLNKEMQKLQANRQKPTKFTTSEPILFNTSNAPFFEFAGFACSELCACNGKCTNNSLYFAQKRMFPLELFRRNYDLGYELRSPKLIPAGTPFLEFTGQISEEKNMALTDQDYAYRITNTGDDKWVNFVRAQKSWTPRYLKLLENAMSNSYHCNPKQYGNVARTACHSCTANVEILRVFQKSLSPAHVRLVMVSLEDIYPGVPITIDYGQEYVQTQLKGTCQCGTFACHNGKHHKLFSLMDSQTIAACLMHINRFDCLTYLKMFPKLLEQYKEQVDVKEYDLLKNEWGAAKKRMSKRSL